MFVKSALLAPRASKAAPCYTGGQPAHTSVANWMGWPAPTHEEAGGYHEEGSNASTTDSNAMDTPSCPLDIHDMEWLSVYPPMAPDMPLPTFAYAGAHWGSSQAPTSGNSFPEMQPSWDPDVQPSWDPQHLSEGSSKHQLGQCKPCAFAWRPEGCDSGPQCKFCHLCPPREKQRRKRVLRQLQRSCATAAVIQAAVLHMGTGTQNADMR